MIKFKHDISYKTCDTSPDSQTKGKACKSGNIY